MWNYINNYFGTLLSIVGALIYVKYILKNKIKGNKIMIILLVFIIPLIILIMHVLNYTLVKTLASLFLCGLLFKIAFNFKFSKSLTYAVSFIVMLTIAEIIEFIFITKVLNISNSYIYNILSASLVGNLIVTSLFLIISYIFRKPLLKVLNVNIKHEFIFNILILFAIIIFFFYMTFSNIDNGIGVVPGVIIIILMIYIFIHILLQLYRNNELTIMYDRLLEFIKKYEVEIDNQRTMRHEIKNQLLTIKSKLTDNDSNASIINYIDEIIDDNNKIIKHSEYAKFNYLPPNGIKGLFYFKTSEAISKGIDVSVNIAKDVNDSNLSKLSASMFNQVGKIIGIFLDNAIEGAELADKKKISIEIYVYDNKVAIIIANTYKRIIKNYFGLFPRSTKGENRGHGLLLANAIVSSNMRLKLETTITDLLYIQKLIIK